MKSEFKMNSKWFTIITFGLLLVAVSFVQAQMVESTIEKSSEENSTESSAEDSLEESKTESSTKESSEETTTKLPETSTSGYARSGGGYAIVSAKKRCYGNTKLIDGRCRKIE